nr:phage late control D family protein [Variovorax sp. CF313]
MYFFFRHEAEQHVLVFADDIASSHGPLQGHQRRQRIQREGLGDRFGHVECRAAEESAKNGIQVLAARGDGLCLV